MYQDKHLESSYLILQIMHCRAPETSQADQSLAVCSVFLVLALASIINNKTSWMLQMFK